MKKHLCIKVIVTTPEGTMLPAFMEVNDHGMDLRFYHPTGRIIASDKVKSWELDKSLKSTEAKGE